MEILLTLTLSDRLFDLLEDKLPNFGRRVEKALTKEIGAIARGQSEINVAVKPGAPVETEPPTEAELSVTATAAKPETTAQKCPGKEDVRAAMHRTRQRFEGEDYQQNTDSELYKKYHKQVSAVFKQIAVSLGADKPSTLAEDRRAAFITACDELVLGEDGNITCPPAF